MVHLVEKLEGPVAVAVDRELEDRSVTGAGIVAGEVAAVAGANLVEGDDGARVQVDVVAEQLAFRAQAEINEVVADGGFILNKAER